MTALREQDRRAAGERMEAFAAASWLALDMDEKLRTWERYLDWARELVGIPLGRPYCPPGHVPAALRPPFHR